jgi:DnaJ-class molecular chaperone
MIGKAICPTCNGNGFIRKKDHVDIRKQSVEQCSTCKSEGEITITHQNLQEHLWHKQKQ